MLKRYLRLELEEIDRQNIRFQPIGRIDGLRDSVRRELQRAVERTAQKHRDGLERRAQLRRTRGDCGRRPRRRRARSSPKGRAPEEMTDDDIGRNLYTRGLPELDLLVRTSGELRISNFLLWQAAYSEIYVTETLWPDFRRADLLEAVVAFSAPRPTLRRPQARGEREIKKLSAFSSQLSALNSKERRKV